MKYARDLDPVEVARRASEFWQWGIFCLALIVAGCVADISFGLPLIGLGAAIVLSIGITIHAKRRLFRD